MSELFVSYKAEDRARVAPLVQALETDGISVWWDEHIGGGDEWRDTILRHLEAAKCVIVVWSKRSVGPHGTFVRDEATRALRRGTYLPVRIDKVDPPLGFGETQALDLQGWKGDRSDARYEAVVSCVRKRLGIHVGNLHAHRTPAANRRTVLIGAGAAGALAIAGGGAWFFARPARTRSDSIAVLPFANLSGDANQAYFSDGIAEELRSALARVTRLKVVGRTSSEAVRNDDAETAAKKLGVANILTGSVRQSPATLRISAQLVDGRTGIEQWSANYDRAPGDTIKIQTDIAENVARAMVTTLGEGARAAIVAGGTENAAAQKLLLEAAATAQSGHKEDLRAAMSLVDGALQLDPGYAQAYVDKSLLLSAYGATFANAVDLPRYRDEALRNARKALRLAQNLPAAHNALAEIYRVSLQLRAADQEYRRALHLGPGESEIVRDYARFASLVGRREESLRLSTEAMALDPLNSDSFRTRFTVLFANRRFADAVQFADKIRRDSPKMFQWPYDMALCLVVLGRPDEALSYVNDSSANDLTDASSVQGLILARAGNREGAEANIEKIRRLYGDAASYQYAEIYAQLGDKPRAFDALERAWTIGDSGLIWLRVDPLLDPLRSEQRFNDLSKKLDFPT